MTLKWQLGQAFSVRSTKRTPIVPVKADRWLLRLTGRTEHVEQLVAAIHQTAA